MRSYAQLVSYTSLCVLLNSSRSEVKIHNLYKLYSVYIQLFWVSYLKKKLRKEKRLHATQKLMVHFSNLHFSNLFFIYFFNQGCEPTSFGIGSTVFFWAFYNSTVGSGSFKIKRRKWIHLIKLKWIHLIKLKWIHLIKLKWIRNTACSYRYRWRASLWKLIWRELAAYVVLFMMVSTIYR